jgi:uncharacterized membrane protein
MRAGLVAGVALCALVACGDGGTGGSCPDDQPAACDGAPASFASVVQPIFQSKCDTCHAPGGVKADKPFVTYAQISAARLSIQSRVVTCQMPQAGAPQLTPDERAALLMWLVCKGPNN